MTRLAAILILAVGATGCSAAKQIGEAATRVRTHAEAATGKLDAALASGDIGAIATPLVTDARGHVVAIREDAVLIQDRVEHVKDKQGLFGKVFDFITNAWFLSVLVSVVAFLWLTRRFTGPIFSLVGGLLGGIVNFVQGLGPTSEKVQTDAEADAIAVVEAERSGTPLPRKRERAIERKKDEVKYRRAFAAALKAERAKGASQ